MLKYKPKAICSFLTFDIRHSLFCGSIFPSIQFSLHQFAPPVSSNRLMSKDKPSGEGTGVRSRLTCKNNGALSPGATAMPLKEPGYSFICIPINVF
jgi:hypothetical protein